MAEQTEIEKIKRELKRKSLDQLKVFNPLDISFSTIYDGYTYKVQPKAEATFLRYIAIKWIREIVDFMINEEERIAVAKENDKRQKKGWAVMNPQEADQFVTTNKLLTSDPEKRSAYMRQVYKGVSQEHGLDIPEIAPVKRDVRPQDEKLLEQLDSEMGIRQTLPEDAETDFEIEDIKDNYVKGISDE